MPKLAVTAFNVPMISNLDEFNRPHGPRRLFLERGGPAVDRPPQTTALASSILVGKDSCTVK